MTITITELKKHFGKYLSLSRTEDVSSRATGKQFPCSPIRLQTEIKT